MNSLTHFSNSNSPSHFDHTNSQLYGSVEIEHSLKDGVYNQIRERSKEYVNWVAPVNILQGLDYMKIELSLPGITKDDCKIGCSGIVLWVKILKQVQEKKETFYCSFILPDNLLTDQIVASCEQNGKLIIVIPKKRAEDSGNFSHAFEDNIHSSI